MAAAPRVYGATVDTDVARRGHKPAGAARGEITHAALGQLCLEPIRHLHSRALCYMDAYQECTLLGLQN